jgi:hypothetical protein
VLPTATRCAIQWGNVAEWVAAVGTVGALLLALWLLAQDRRNAQRAQVDLVGAWSKPMYERKSPDAPRVEKAQTVIYVRNGSQLPVEVKQLAYSIHTQWWVPVLGSKLVSKPVPGTEPIRAFVNDLRIPPRRTWNNKTYPYEFDLAHTVPERAQQLDLIQGVRCEIDWLLLVDRRARLRTVPGNSPNSAAVAANAAGQPC